MTAQTADAPVARSSFYAAMRILPKRQRAAMFALYAFCRAVDDVADEPGPATPAERLAELERWRADVAAMFAGRPSQRLSDLAQAVRDFNLQHKDFDAVIDGMAMDAAEDIRAPDWATLDLYCDRVAGAVGRLSVRIFGLPDEQGEALAHHLGRALQLINILRDIDEDAAMGRLYLPREALESAGVKTIDPLEAAADPKLAARLRRSRRLARGRISARRNRSWTRRRGRRSRRRVSWPPHTARSSTGWSPKASRRRASGSGRAGRGCSLRFCATASYDRWRRPCHRGGRRGLERCGAPCRGRASRDRARGGAGRGRPLSLLFRPDAGPDDRQRQSSPALRQPQPRSTISTASARPPRMTGPGAATFDFADLGSGERWRLRLNDGRVPWWLFDRSRRAPGTALREYLAPLPMILRAPASETVGEAMRCAGPLYERLWRPLLLAGLNTEPKEGSAALAAGLMRETLGAGGHACHPLVAARGLSHSLHRSGAGLPCRARRRDAPRRAAAGRSLRGDAGGRPRFRRRAGARSATKTPS